MAKKKSYKELEQELKNWQDRCNALQCDLSQSSIKVGSLTQQIKAHEDMIVEHRLELVRLRERNDALQSALTAYVYTARNLQRSNQEFLDQYHIKEGLFLAG